MAKGVVTITLASGDGSIQRGMRLTTSSGSGRDQTFWVVGKKSATELLVASTWRDSWWVLWFQVWGWVLGVWEKVRSRYRRDDYEGDYPTDDVAGPVMVAPDESSDHDVNPKTLN